MRIAQQKTETECKRPHPLAICISIFCLLALLVGLGWWREIIDPPGDTFFLRWLIIFIVVPIVILISQLFSFPSVLERSDMRYLHSS